MIWHKQGTSPDRPLSMNDVKFTCHVMSLQRRIHVSLNRWLSNLASTVVLALVEKRLAPLNSLYFLPHPPHPVRTGSSNTLLANEVTLMTSYGYCCNLKNQRCPCCCLSFVRPGGYSVRCWEALCHRDTETGPLPQQRHILIQLVLRE